MQETLLLEQLQLVHFVGDGSQLTNLPIPPASGGFPAGTKMIFQQENPPTGWTIDSTMPDHALRVNSGTWNDVDGSVDFSALFKGQSLSISVTGSTDGTAAGGGGNTMDRGGGISASSSSLVGSQMPSHSHKYVVC